MDITGTAAGETLDGTEFGDLISGLGGNDILNGLGGSDTLNGGAGIDQFYGGDGDDTIVLDVALEGAETYNGGSGTDSIEVRPIGAAATTTYAIGGATFSSIERLVFASTASSALQVATQIGKIASSGLTELVGGAGRDTFVINTPNGSFAVPTLTLTNWAGAPVDAWTYSGDTIRLVSGFSGSTLTAATGLDAFQMVIGLNGDDILNGSANADALLGGGGVNQLYGNGGNDALVIANSTSGTVTTFFTGAGSIFDGGDGIDVLSVGGSVDFLGTLANIEGIHFQPAFSSPTFSQAAAELEINTARLAMLPADLFLTGTGTLDVDLSEGESFDASAFTFAAGSNVTLIIDGEEGDGVSYIGTSNGDYINFGMGQQTATGGGGADVFSFEEGQATITDFAVGEDRLDLSETAITGEARLADFLAEVAGNTVLSAQSGGETTSLTLQGVTLAEFDTDDIDFAQGGEAEVETGTELDDLLFGFELNDQLSGLGGNDRLYGGGGADQLYGGDGDDRLILDELIAGGGIYDGGAGSDTLELRAAAHNLVTAAGGTSSYGLTGPAANMVGIETIQFGSDSETAVLASLLYGNVAAMGLTTLVGGAGLDSFLVIATAGGSYSMPDLALVNWSPASGIGSPGDALILSGSNAGASYTLTAREGLAATQNLLGNAAADILTGSSGRELLNGRGGVNQLSGLGGDDILVIANIIPMTLVDGVPTAGEPSTLTGAGSSFDGGDGTDYLSVGGAVEFLGTLTSIEGIYFQAAFTSTTVGVASQAAAELQLTGETLAGLPAGLLLGGTGTLWVDLDPGDNFDGSSFVFAAGSAITLEIEGSSSDDRIALTSVADNVDGIAGSDTVVFAGNRSDYLVAAGSGGAVLIGADSFTNVEFFEFANGTFYWNGSQLVTETSGVVADGYIAGATVFIDADGDGRFDDAGDGTADLDGDGLFDTAEPFAISEADGDFTLISSVTGTLRAVGGTNIDTGLDNLLTLSAPEGASVINPLTTLVQALIDDGFDAAAAEAEVESSLGLADLDLLNVDLIEAAEGGDAGALDAQKAAAAIAEVLNAVVEAGGDEAAALGSIAELIDDGTTDLSNPSILTTVIEESTDLTDAQVSQLVEETAAITGAIADADTLDAISEIQGNNPPVAAADAAGVAEDAAVTGNLLTNDSTGDSDNPDSTDVLAVTAVNATAVTGTGQTIVAGLYGTLTIAANGSFSYSANAEIVDAYPADSVLLDEFSYSISHGNGGIAASTLSLTVTTIADTVILGPPVKGTLTGTSGDDFILGSSRTDTLNGGAGADRIYGGKGEDKLHGGDGFDMLLGQEGSDRLYGGTGDDVLVGGAGADRIEGGAGADSFLFAAGSGSDTLADFELGIDRISLDGVTATGYSSSAGSLVVNLSGGGSILLAGVAAGSDPTQLFGDLPDWAVI